MNVYTHRVRVRYGECDMQGVVFNAHYLAYADDAVDTWLRDVLPNGLYASGGTDAAFDMMAKATSIVWSSPLRFGEVADLACEVTRWGTTSFDVTITGTVTSAPRFVIVITYVSIGAASQRPCPVPDNVRAALGTPSPARGTASPAGRTVTPPA